jgi:YD repeat-containing protein
VSKTVYNAASEVVQVQTAVGTADQSTEITSTYNLNGTTASVKDGEANLTTYEYDGFDRLVKTRYPSPTQGAGTSSVTDFEQLSYDANGNVTQRVAGVKLKPTLLTSGGGLCHQCRKDLVGCEEVEYFAWPIVEAFGDDVEVGLCVRAEVGALGEILLYEARSALG